MVYRRTRGEAGRPGRTTVLCELCELFPMEPQRTHQGASGYVLSFWLLNFGVQKTLSHLSDTTWNTSSGQFLVPARYCGSVLWCCRVCKGKKQVRHDPWSGSLLAVSSVSRRQREAGAVTESMNCPPVQFKGWQGLPIQMHKSPVSEIGDHQPVNGDWKVNWSHLASEHCNTEHCYYILYL